MSKIEYSNFLFDLDGTLVDSKAVILNCIKNTLKHFKVYEKNQNISYNFIGLPLKEIFSKYYNLDELKTKIAIEKYRECYEKEGISKIKLYSGTIILLKKLLTNNKKLYLTTSKLQSFSIDILKNFGIIKYFAGIYGATRDEVSSSKSAIIQRAIQENNLNIKNTVMIGDRSYDIVGAKKNHIDSIGVLYGYGDYEELFEAKATYIVKNVEELVKNLTK